ncbi:MAG: response regulator [Candidatus Sericytochromatia bacterium]|nr:response regulator [Candidatus Sericytochromatia bacterium]
MEEQARILVIEDDRPILNFLKTSLANKGYQVTAVMEGEKGLAEAAQNVPDLVITDLGLPDMDGLEVVSRLREWTELPIIILSAREKERDKVEALDKGANDYLTKPFGLNELLARMRVSLRHASRLKGQAEEKTVYQIGALNIDLASRRIFKGDEEIHLTAIEYKLLSTMVRHAGKVLTQRYLLNEVWGSECVEHPQYLRVYMASLRRKIEVNTAQPEYIITEQGIGYRFAEDNEISAD